MLTEFKDFDIKGFFALGSEAIAINFLVILFMPQARISKKVLLVGPGVSISISLISSSDTPSNQIKLLISFRTFSFP